MTGDRRFTKFTVGTFCPTCGREEVLDKPAALRAAAQAVVDVFDQHGGWQPNDLYDPIAALRAALDGVRDTAAADTIGEALG